MLRHTHRYIYSEGQNGIRDKALVHLIGIRFGIKLDMWKTVHHLNHNLRDFYTHCSYYILQMMWGQEEIHIFLE